jgi:hypothetical protein
VSSKIDGFLATFVERISNRKLMRASLWLFLYASLPAAVLGGAVTIAIQYFFPAIAETIGTGAGQRNLGWFPALIFNPLFESFLLVSWIAVGARLNAGKLAIVGPALLIAALHAFGNIPWGLAVFSYFLIQSYAIFHVLKCGFRRSWILASVAHAMHNASILAAVFCLARLR